MSIGIDYGGGKTNIDPETSIRFGVISSHKVNYWNDSSEEVYGPPHCPHCGSEIPEEIRDNAMSHDDEETRTCPHCEKVLKERDFEEQDSEIIGFKMDDGKYFATQSADDTDIFIEKSPYYTLCGYCSPCAPGAGYITQQEEDGIKAYCFGHDFFEDGKAPYKVFDVKTDKEILPEKE
jgi:hypothetical protein